MEFIFKNGVDKSNLLQGDLLSRTPVLRDALKTAHPYYAEASDYTHFMVITQSCDLVRRGRKPPKSRYITVAAARPLSIVLDRVSSKHSEPLQNFPLSVFRRDRKISTEQFLDRLLHNTESSFFFVRKDSVSGVTQDLCVFLALSVALRADEHYEACAQSKLAELEDVFAAKVGWLVGNMYSRVGTPDFEESVQDPKEYRKSFFEEAMSDDHSWLTTIQIRWLKKELKNWERDNKGVNMSDADAIQLLTRVPSSEALVADRVAQILLSNKIISPDNIDSTKNVLSSDTIIQSLSRQNSPFD